MFLDRVGPPGGEKWADGAPFRPGFHDSENRFCIVKTNGAEHQRAISF
jgi:hypothetical protein